MFVHFGSFEDFSLQELDHLLDVALADKICHQLEHFLIYFQRYHSVIFNDGKDISGVVFENFHVVLA